MIPGDSAPAASDLVRELAARQLREYRAVDPGRYFGEEHPPLSIDEAYAVQDEVARLRLVAGDAIAGYKIGCVGPKILEQFGMSGPIAALLYRSEVHRSGAALPASAFAALAVEGEVAVRIGDDGGIAAAFPVVELHNFVFRGARKTLAELIANNGLNAGVVVPVDGRRSLGGSGAELSVTVDGIEIDRGAPWAMPGGAEESVRWLRRHLEGRGRALEPGHLVLTGTPLGLHPVHAGDVVSVTWGGGSVEMRVLGERSGGAYDRRGAGARG